MAVAGRSGDAPPASDAAARLRDSGFVRLLARPTGDALAATGLLAHALDTLDFPFQARIGATGVPDALADDETTVILGATAPAADIELPGVSRPASHVAFEMVRALDGALDPDPVLALAGAFAADAGPLAETAGSALDAARERGVEERRPGVSIPVADLVDGLAHTTLVHAPFSGDTERTASAIADLDLDAPDTEDHRTVASWLALVVAGEGTPRATDALERALRPLPTADSFVTVGGYADVLDAVAHEAPGTGLALVLGHDVATAALSAWREHARRAHTAVREATVTTVDSIPDVSETIFVARVEATAPLTTTARLVADFRTPGQTVTVTDGRAVATRIETLREPMNRATTTLDGTTTEGRRLSARFEGSADAFVSALREDS